MKIRVEGDGHCVEIEHGDTNRTPEQLAELAEHVWKNTKSPGQPRLTMGYGGAYIERAADHRVAGDGAWTSPVTS